MRDAAYTFRRLSTYVPDTTPLRLPAAAHVQDQDPAVLTFSPVTLSGGRGTFYRLKAGPFTDSASANEVCSALKARRVYCVVGDFSGTQ